MSTAAATEQLSNLSVTDKPVPTAKQIKEAPANKEEPEEEEEIFFEIPSFEELDVVLRDESAPIAKRMRTCFLLKQLACDEVIPCLAYGLTSPSILLAHECAYVLGQLQNPLAVPYLTETLADETANPIIRHEAAEALAAIGQPSSYDLLLKYSTDPCKEVADTCIIAVEKFKWVQQHGPHVNTSRFCSVDPAPPAPGMSVEDLEKMLLDTSLSFFDRYRAMFGLRENGSEEAVLALAKGFSDESAVFRHEVAYVMGQIQHPAAIASLKTMLVDAKEHPMVRHEAAEALGSIADDEAVTNVLKHYQGDDDKIVAQSCDVALDLVDYWNNDEHVTALNIDNPEDKNAINKQ